MSPWLTVEELTAVGFARSPVVMANEAHSGMLRCSRTRQVGVRMVRAAHRAGVRRLAMEALPSHEQGPLTAVPDVDGGYLAQPDMRALIGCAVDLGWTLWPYEIALDVGPDGVLAPGLDLLGVEFTNRRERAQAENLARIAETGEQLLVWCGNGHAAKDADGPEWVSMGWHFGRLTGIDAFAIDQTVTAEWPGHGAIRPDIVPAIRDTLEAFGGTAALLREDVPAEEQVGDDYDAYICSLDNTFS